MIRTPMQPKHNLEVNTNNHREYEPYYDSEDALVIDKTWWKTVPDIVKQKVTAKMNIMLEDLNIPHEHNVVKTTREMFIYTAFCDAFDYDQWCHTKSDPYKLIEIPRHLKKLFVSCNITGNKPHPDILEWIPDLPWETCFARLGATSGKNERPVRPMKTKDDLIEYLTGGNSILVGREFAADKNTFLVLMPWKEIPRRFEFRAFFRDNKVIGASQQFISTLFNYSQEELEDFVSAFETLSFPKVPYHEWTADAYWDVKTKTMKLIECNPYGPSTGCGSSLFHWIRDRNALLGLTQPEFKYLSIINF